jgi:hypothetical protein
MGATDAWESDLVYSSAFQRTDPPISLMQIMKYPGLQQSYELPSIVISENVMNLKAPTSRRAVTLKKCSTVCFRA